jgi:calcineurin-like phosphoesterase family protein
MTTTAVNYDRVWVASDLLFGGVGGRERGYESRFLKAWDHTVDKDDVVVLLGNLAINRHAYWLQAIKDMPGVKRLVVGDQDRNRVNWYKKFGFVTVTPFGDYDTLDVKLGENEHNEAYFGKIMLSHFPAFIHVGNGYAQKFKSVMSKLEKQYDIRSNILNIHGHTRGHSKPTHRTQDVSLDVIGDQLVTINQVMNFKFHWDN